jgi:Ca-activated chloride channel family protein
MAMTEDELKALKDHAAPPPRADAKAAALAAAMAAFDAGAAGDDASAKNSADATQGNEAAPRPMHASQADRRRKMRARILYRVAAGFAAILVATPAAVYFLDPSLIVGKHYALRTKEAERPSPDGKTLIYDRLDTESDAPARIAGRSEEPTPGGTLEERIQHALSNLKKTDDNAPPPAEAPVKVSPPDRYAGENTRMAQPQADPGVPPPPPTPLRAQEQQAAPVLPAPASLDGASGRADRKREEPAKPESKVANAEPQPSQASSSPKPKARIGAIFTPADKAQRDGQAAAGAPGGSAVARQGLAGYMAPNAPAPSVEPLPADQRVIVQEEKDRDQFEAKEVNPVKQVAAEPVSTFSIDVDSASYAFVRRALNAGRLPPKDSVRVEEMINYFPYDYPRPETSEVPFQPTVTVVPAPWKPANKLIHIGIKGYDVVPAERPRANIVLLIDVSGSMASADRLPLVKNAFRMLVDELKPDDTVGIVTYASGSGIALEPTKVSDKAKILAAIDALGAGGSTAGAAGINDAYRLAEAHFDKTGVNRIILATDGDFNVGISNKDELKGFIERKRAGGIFLSVLGVGQGNYNDSLMQTLAQNGNGTAAYADTLNEARKVLVDEASSTLFTIAKDVKIQVEFNPAAVSEYRLIGYETRALRREDFNNDKVDAGDIGSGHTVTAIYEVTPVGAPKLVDDLRYGQPGAPAAAPLPTPNPETELGFLKLRYKLPKEDVSKLISVPITPSLEKPDMGAAPEDVRFSVAAAAFGQILRGQPYVGGYGFDDVLKLAQTARGQDAFGYRAEFLNLVRLAKSARP